MRRGPGRLRGWGGAAGMAVACAVTAAVTLVPLSLCAGPPGGGAGPETDRTGGTGVVRAAPAAAAECDDSRPDESLRPSGEDGATIEAIRKRAEKNGEEPKLVVGVDQNSYRWGYRNPATGELEGFDIDLAREIADRILGDPDDVVFRAIPTNQRIPALQAGRVDMIVRTMTISCERKAEGVEFSTAYFRAGQQVLAPKSSPVKGYDETLNGKRVCAAAGSTAESALMEKSFGSKIIRVDNQLDCLVRLQLGQVDAVVTDNALAAGQAAQDPSVELKGDAFTTEYYGVAVKKGSDDLVRRINQVLEDYRESKWSRAYDKWLKADMGEDPGPPDARYRDN
ncbi:glutamate ABC transporter substrate-binding protein [Streptomyces sp. GC420]|uniref:glutamate ABC transporter substrate-binding protein n=1 Tax=Streptomyces sp. GC420 TaxID=2697568 RepID=UPI0014152B24|nr:glutamate ABC transporter substrate-binding protein [Streptomyces sp. GC420]NBM16327.1 transporter substrate-binding domain-containing protein [Streptomyces sp. GC420]